MEPPRVVVQFDLICATSGQTDRSNRWAPGGFGSCKRFRFNILQRDKQRMRAHRHGERAARARFFEWFLVRREAFCLRGVILS